METTFCTITTPSLTWRITELDSQGIYNPLINRSVSKSDDGTSFGDVFTVIAVMAIAGLFIALIMWACKEKQSDVAPESQHYVQMRNNP